MFYETGTSSQSGCRLLLLSDTCRGKKNQEGQKKRKTTSFTVITLRHRDACRRRASDAGDRRGDTSEERPWTMVMSRELVVTEFTCEKSCLPSTFTT